MTLLLIIVIVAVAIPLIAVAVSLSNLAGRKPDMPDEDGNHRHQAELDLLAWRQEGRVRIVEPKEPKP